MIIKAKERGGGAQLARYLLTMRDNDNVELHEVRGFVSDDLLGAFREADAIAAGTRCQNYLFSISLNPPQSADVSIEDFEKAADDVERKLGLDDQPRSIVFHEKDGRRHAHVVWSRIDTDRMRAINLSHYKLHLPTHRDLMHSITLEIFTEIWLSHNGLLASKLGKKASTILGAIQTGERASVKSHEQYD